MSAARVYSWVALSEAGVEVARYKSSSASREEVVTWWPNCTVTGLISQADHEAALAAVTADLEAHAVSMMKRKDAALRDWQDERDAAERLRARLGEVEAEVARLRGLLRSLQRRFVDPATHPTTYAEISKELSDG